MKIAIANDVAMAAEALRRVVASTAEHQVLWIARTGLEAVRMCADNRPDLILMDVVMPGQNGFQLTRSINRTPEYTDIPIIICTSKSLETDRVWGMRQGARDYITKPVDATELFAKIKALG